MSFRWDAIDSYGDSEVALYRLLGEMLQRKATLDDLARVRAFLLHDGPTADSWRSLGEALHRTTSGSPSGYDIWVDWTRSLANFDFDSSRQADEWMSFGDERSEATDVHFDPRIELVPGREPTLADDDEEELDTSTGQQSVPRFLPSHTGVLAESATQLLRFVPSGPYTVRLFGRKFEGVDEYRILTLMKRGLFLGCEVRFGGAWLPAAQHPAFEKISARLEEEALRILSSSRPLDEATQPG